MIKKKAPFREPLMLLDAEFLFELVNVSSESLVGIHQVVYCAARVQYSCVIFTAAMHSDSGQR